MTDRTIGNDQLAAAPDRRGSLREHAAAERPESLYGSLLGWGDVDF
jgi:hypothetical protein